MKNPLRVEQLRKHTHLSLLGLVFDVSVYEELYGSKGSLVQLTGHNEIHQFCQPSVPHRFALDGLSELQLVNIMRWLQFLSSNYQCIGELDENTVVSANVNKCIRFLSAFSNKKHLLSMH
ncbi:uncharacterized protein DEA37_0007855 [Paragonimus westermani]|uniref:Uncharacterized protein n=1 Tax=Paragonimus westermani TaxID=34504 RepID=A0A5J4NHX0_9TREM|nr:uncharacterized protein DEA37_0007855 [Paragonimus westermani]